MALMKDVLHTIESTPHKSPILELKKPLLAPQKGYTSLSSLSSYSSSSSIPEETTTPLSPLFQKAKPPGGKLQEITSPKSRLFLFDRGAMSPPQLQERDEDQESDIQTLLLGKAASWNPDESLLEGEELFKGHNTKEDPRKVFTPSWSDALPDEQSNNLQKRESQDLSTNSKVRGNSHKGLPSHLFQKKKKDKQFQIEREPSWKGEMAELMVLKKVGEKFYWAVNDHFSWFEPNMFDNSREIYFAFTTYITPNLTPNTKRKMNLVTRYLFTITEFVSGSGGSSGALLMSEKIERVEDLEFGWVLKAESVWKSTQWVKILHKTVQESNETLITSEIEGLKDLMTEYLQFLKYTKDALRREILEKMCYYLLEHLSTHSLDPCNLFYGSIPSEKTLKSEFVPVKARKGEGRRRADTLEGLLDMGWQQSRKRVERGGEGGEGDVIQEIQMGLRGEENKDQKTINQARKKEPGKEKEEVKEEKEQEKEKENTETEETDKTETETDRTDIEEDGDQDEDQDEDQDQEKERRESKPRKSYSPRNPQPQQPQPPSSTPLDYRDILYALTRWSSLKYSPQQVVREVDSLLSLLSLSITCPVGSYVAVNVSSFTENRKWFWNSDVDPKGSYKFVLFRLAEPLFPSDIVAHIFLDCFETKQKIVPIEELLYYKDDSTTSLRQARNCKSSLFESPLFMYFDKIQCVIKEEVATFIRNNGAKHDPSRTVKLNYNGLEELCRDRMILETILASPHSIRSFVPSLVKPLMKRSDFWASQIPPMLFPLPRLNDAIEEIFAFTSDLPSLTENEIQVHFSVILYRIALFKKRGSDLKSGKLKNEMCQWWLGYIEKRVDKFLTKQGYIHNTLPDDYLNTPPPDITSVFMNQALLGEIIAEEGDMEGKYGVGKMVEEVVGEVYEKVDSLREEMEFMLEKKWVGLPLGVEWEGDIELEEGGEIMKRDHDYLVKMKEMDEEIKQAKKEGTMEKKKLELSDVVPMAGLVMARFHIYNCELNTALSHWAKMDEMAKKRCGEAMGFLELVNPADLKKIKREKRERDRLKRESETWAGVWAGEIRVPRKKNKPQ